MNQLSNVSALQVFQVIRYGTLILIGIGLAKLGILPSEIGRFETFLMVSGMLTYFWVSGTINSLLAIYGKSDVETQKSLFFTAFVLLICLGIVFGGLLFVFSKTLIDLTGTTSDASVFKLVSIYIVINTPSFLIEYILWLKNKREGLLYYGLLLSFSMLASTLLPVGYNLSIEYAIYGLLFIAFLKFVITLFLLFKYSSYNIDFEHIKRFSLIAFPVMLSILISGSSEYIDGIIVKAKFDDMHFAIYRYGAKELPILLILANTFSTAMIPALAGNLSSGLGQLKEKSASMMRWFFPISMGLMLLSPFIFKYFFSESFIYSSFIFNIYLLLVIPRLVFPQTILTALGYGKYLVISSILEISINVSLSIYLAGIMGLPGIALGTLIAFCIDKIFLMLVTHYIYGIKVSSYVNLKEYALFSVITLICFGISIYLLKSYSF